MRIKSIFMIIFFINGSLIFGCRMPAPDCKPLYVEKPSDMDSIIDIRQPGKYCLMSDLHSRLSFPDHPGELRLIRIWVSNVELDLMGHTLGRGRWFPQKGGSGIQAYDVQNIIVKNGTLKDFDDCLSFVRSKVSKPYFEKHLSLNANGSGFYAAANLRFENISFKNCSTNISISDWIE